MPLAKNLYTELWHRAAREEIGIKIRFSDASAAKWMLNQNRPDGFEEFTLCKPTYLGDILMILRPGVELHAESNAHAARQIFSDLE